MPNNNNYIGFSKPDGPGTLYWAPSGTKVPTSATDPMEAQFISLGRLSEDGFTEAAPFDDPEPVKVDGNVTVDYVNSGYISEWNMVLMQYSDIATARIVYGANNVTVNGDGYTVEKNDHNYTNGVFIIRRLVGKASESITVIKHGTMRRSDDVVHNANDLLGIPVKITSEIDADGNYSIEYIGN